MKVYDPENEFDEEYFEFGLFMSRREYKTINRRLQRGRTSSAKEGKFVGANAPYGYEKIRIPNDKGFTLRPIEAEADIVRLIFQLYTYGELQDNGQMKQLGTYSIALRLDNMGIDSPTSKSNWSDRTVKQILSNPVYIGKIRWKNRKSQKRIVDGVLTVERVFSSPEEQILVDGIHPALVSEETFLKAQELLERKSLPPIPNKNYIANPLAGILVCGKCGHSIERTTYSGLEKLRCINRSCNNVSSYYSVVEEKLLQSLSQWLSKYRLQWSESKTDSESNLIELQQKAIKKTQNDISTLNKQLARTHDLLEQGCL